MITTGGEGKVPPRKRLRGKIGNPSSAPELKTHNLMVEGVDTNNSFYTVSTTKGVYTNGTNGVWYPIVGKWPTVGTDAHQRIGNKIRVKLLRLKGVVAYSPYLITQVRYRIVMYRSAKKMDTYSFQSFLLPMYSSFFNINASVSVDGKQNNCAMMYYCSFFNKDYMRDNDIKRRVLFRGIIKPQADIGNYGISPVQWVGELAPGNDPTVVSSTTAGKHFGKIWTKVQQGDLYESKSYFNEDNVTDAPENVVLGSSTALHHVPIAFNQPQQTLYGLFQQHYTTNSGSVYDATTFGNQRGFFPIDITVHMNDNIDCEKYKYIFVVESDWCIGQDVRGQFGYVEDDSNFLITFIPQIYYTDD